MNKIIYTLILSLIFSIYAISQKPSDIFAEGKEYIYKVIFIKSNGDTLTNEKMIMRGKDEKWKYQRIQSLLEYDYFPDTINLKNYVDPRSKYQKRVVKNLKKKAKGKKGWSNYTWIENHETTGKVITDSSIWLHPPRDNQYGYHYMIAYPEIMYNQLFVGGNWKQRLRIYKSFPGNKEFVGLRIDDFEVTEKLSLTFNNKQIEDCWRIKIKSKHDVQGEVLGEYIFSESCGFLKMENSFYDGVKINYILKDIIVN